jgi:hypothetical protein
MVDVAGVHPSTRPYLRSRGIVHVAGVASRQVSATAQQIAAAAGSLADLAGNLEATAATTRERY